MCAWALHAVMCVGACERACERMRWCVRAHVCERTWTSVRGRVQEPVRGCVWGPVRGCVQGRGRGREHVGGNEHAHVRTYALISMGEWQNLPNFCVPRINLKNCFIAVSILLLHWLVSSTSILKIYFAVTVMLWNKGSFVWDRACIKSFRWLTSR